MQKRWVVKKSGSQEEVRQLADSLKIDDVLANLLVQRGIKTFEEARSFFRPEISQLHDPYFMTDMYKAVKRIEAAIENHEKILIYGDYDVDGTTAVALVYSFLYTQYKEVGYYIPDRYKEGYGISMAGIDFATANKYTLVIALDCGIKAIEQVSYANQKGIDFIICDHHRPGEKLPEAYAILDPKRNDCSYPFKELSGCGIGYKLIQAFGISNNIPTDETESFLDLVVLSIAADIVPINGENRILAYYGLKKLNANPRPGIEAILIYSNIIKKSGSDINKIDFLFNREITINDLVFLVGPRLNAAGRIDSGKNAVDLLISADLTDAKSKGHNLNISNNERKNLDTQTTTHAIEIIKNDEALQRKKSTVLFHPEWHKGVIGIVASRLTEIYYKPTIILTQSNGLITGSARSIKDFDLYEAIDSCSDILEHFGGHKYAAGLSLRPENLIEFTERFEKIAAAKITELMQSPEIEIDSYLNLKNINNKFINILKQFAPFGPENLSPLFATSSVSDTGNARIVGNKHLKLKVAQEKFGMTAFDAIAFQLGDFLPQIENGAPFNICYHIEENDWAGNTIIQFNIKDISFD
jgi:single-stranded-DNA-specific exonuclease